MPRRVLIVEDDPTFRAALEVAIAPIAEVLCAATGRDALRRLETTEVEAVVTDLEMPLMDGYELIERLRADTRWRAMPVVVVSGATDTEARERVLRLGADAFFAKPYSPAEVRVAVEGLLNARGSHA
ncbi:MAG: response regulator [Bryobacteraceae bacterium]|nr:response regulator [Bryobacteraceae bacterium]